MFPSPFPLNGTAVARPCSLIHIAYSISQSHEHYAFCLTFFLLHSMHTPQSKSLLESHQCHGVPFSHGPSVGPFEHVPCVFPQLLPACARATTLRRPHHVSMLSLAVLQSRPFSELSGKQETFKPKRDPSRKVHIHRAGQRPAGANDEEKVEAPPSKPRKGESRAALERARAKIMEGTLPPKTRWIDWLHSLGVARAVTSPT